MREDCGKIISNELISEDTYKMVIESALTQEMKP